MNDESLTIVLPLPPAILSPNRPCASRGGRIGRAVAQKRQRRMAREATEAAGIETAPWGKVEAQAVFFHSNTRRRDGANFNAMLKGAFDGIVDAGLAVDDDHLHWKTLPPEFQQDPKSPRVEITITKTA